MFVNTGSRLKRASTGYICSIKEVKLDIESYYLLITQYGSSDNALATIGAVNFDQRAMYPYFAVLNTVITSTRLWMVLVSINEKFRQAEWRCKTKDIHRDFSCSSNLVCIFDFLFEWRGSAFN